MIKTYVKDLLFLLVITCSLYVLHNGLKGKLNLELGDSFVLEQIYLFNGMTSVLVLSVIYWRYSQDKSSAGKTYFILVFMKLFGALAYMWPWIQPKTEFSKSFAANFLIAFFSLLFIETILLVRILNRPLSENSKNDENQ